MFHEQLDRLEAAMKRIKKDLSELERQLTELEKGIQNWSQMEIRF